jgi:threonine/homoserine/homoserine lactone efflux protein
MQWLELKEAVIIGVIMAFMIGPVFFMLVETSITKGFRAAMVFDIGVLFGDIVFLTIAYLGSKAMLSRLENNPIYLKIGGLLLIIYGVYAFFKTKQKHEILDETLVVREEVNYLKLLAKGFLLNIINIGVLGFWIGVLFVYGTRYQMNTAHLLPFFGAILLTYIVIDVFKIFMAKKLRDRMTPSRVYKMKKLVAIIIAVFGLVLFFKSYIPDEQLEEIEKRIETPIKNLQEKKD